MLQNSVASEDWVANVNWDKPLRLAASMAFTTAWWLLAASALITKIVLLSARGVNAAVKAATVRPSTTTLLTEYDPCALTVKIICLGFSVWRWSSATGSVKLISVSLDHVVLSIKKITTTNKMSMKGIKLISGSAGEFLRNFNLILQLAAQSGQMTCESICCSFHGQKVIVNLRPKITPKHQRGNGDDKSESCVVQGHGNAVSKLSRLIVGG